MAYEETCPNCGAATMHLVHVEAGNHIRVDCAECGNVVAIGEDPTFDPRMPEGSK